MGKIKKDKNKTKAGLIKKPAKPRRKAAKSQGVKTPDKNITERKHAEQVLRESEYQYRTLVENIPDYVARFNRQYRHIFVNERTLKATGSTFEQMINKSHRDMGYPAYLCDLFEGTMDEVFKTGQPREKTFEWESPSGLRTIEWRAFPEFASEGKVKTILALCRDITEQKKTEEVIKSAIVQAIEEKNKAQAIIGALGDGIIIQDTNYRIVYQNKIQNDLYGDHNGEYCYKVYEGRDAVCENCPVEMSFRDGEIHKVEKRIADDKGIKYLELTASPLRNSEGRIIAGIKIIRDITRQKQLAEALQGANEELEVRVKERTAELSEMNQILVSEITERNKIEDELRISAGGYRKLLQEFHALFDAIPDSLVMLNLNKEIVWANKSAAHDFGVEDESGLLGHSYTELCNKIKASSEDCPAVKSLSSGKEEQSQVLTKSQEVLDIRAFPILDESGRVQSVIELSRDITSKIQAEKEARQMQAEMIRANRMTSLGTLVSGVVHEINNPNSFILSNSEVLNDIWKDAGRILKEYYKENDNQRLGNLSFSEALEVVPELIKGVIYGSVRINNIVSNLKNFSRPATTGIWGRVSSREVIMSSSTILSSQISKYTDNFHINCDQGIPYLKGNFQQIEQVIMNIILNALQSLPHKNCGVWISDSFDEKSNAVIIQVKDNGIGMPGDIIERITEPFFTTKLEQGGTGLGLSISYSIVREHSGALEFESSPKAGTTVKVKLPVYNPAA